MTGDAGRPWILLVEDEADIREVVSMVLEEQGYRVIGAADGREGLARMRAGRPPALVILDLMMPGMDGWQFRDAQRQDPALASVPVLVLSGDGHVERKAASLDVAGYLRKPIGVTELLRHVERFVPVTRSDAAAPPPGSRPPG